MVDLLMVLVVILMVLVVILMIDFVNIYLIEHPQGGAPPPSQIGAMRIEEGHSGVSVCKLRSASRNQQESVGEQIA